MPRRKQEPRANMREQTEKLEGQPHSLAMTVITSTGCSHSAGTEDSSHQMHQSNDVVWAFKSNLVLTSKALCVATVATSGIASLLHFRQSLSLPGSLFGPLAPDLPLCIQPCKLSPAHDFWATNMAELASHPSAAPSLVDKCTGTALLKVMVL